MTQELFREDAYLKSCDATVVSVTDEGIVLDRTVFYPVGGGQPGDTGTLSFDGGEVSIENTCKGEGVLHVPAPDADLPKVGDHVTATLNWDQRYLHMRMHTALHLLCSLVEGDVNGGQIGAVKSRLDFNIPENPDKVILGDALNGLISAGHDLTSYWITDEELDAKPEMVRTMSVAPPRGSGRIRMIQIGGIDLQPCGGTHVKNTAEIGLMRIGKIENKGKQNRRINILFED